MIKLNMTEEEMHDFIEAERLELSAKPTMTTEEMQDYIKSACATLLVWCLSDGQFEVLNSKFDDESGKNEVEFILRNVSVTLDLAEPEMTTDMIDENFDMDLDVEKILKRVEELVKNI